MDKTQLKEDYTIVSFSGGKDSTAMLLGLIDRGEHIDEVLYCDTSVEFPDMYTHIEKIKEYLRERERSSSQLFVQNMILSIICSTSPLKVKRMEIIMEMVGPPPSYVGVLHI